MSYSKDDLRTVFGLIDTNKDGRVTKDELLSLGGFGGISADAIDKLFNGSSGISFDSFADLFK